MGPLSYKSSRVLCCGRLHMWTKFGDDWSKTANCIAENVTISFKHEYRGHTLTSRCDVIGDVIIMKIGLVDDLHTIFLYLLSNWGYIENCEKFLNWRKFEVQANFFIIIVTGSMLYQPDSQGHSLHFELLIEVLAKKLRELWQFQNLAYFLSWWPSFVTFLIVQVTCRNQWPSTYMDPIWWWFVKTFVNYAWKCANFV